ncbi:MAG: 4-hydroxythreonine-4-phosphate dehydrogenase PdxA, partial [Planctomycetia bacterium]|nr:4-hydroxythreonine-4-phosphate dehydrogenase PdxA [Planctomycetia bacterium]
MVAITMGDAAGTGPELIVKALAGGALRDRCRPLVVGDVPTMERALQFTGAAAKIRGVATPAAARFSPEAIDVLDLRNLELSRLKLGQVDAMAGKAAYEYVKAATELALAGRVAAVVTSAINKEALNLAGYHYDGHTGLLAELCAAPDATMMLAVDNLRVSHVSTHVSLREAIDRVQPERIIRVLRLTHDAVRNLGVAAPRLAVAGLNPHAGEHGLFGDEEEKFIAPAIAEARRLGLDARGPFPGDTVFFRAMQGEFDAAIAMYHDQG